MSALKFVGKHMKRHKGKIIISLVLSIVISLVSSLGPYIMKLIVDVGIPEGRIEYILILSSMAVAVYFLYSMGNFLLSYIFTLLSETVNLDIKKEIYNKLMYYPLSFFGNKEKGYILARTNEINSIKPLFSSTTCKLGLSIIEFVIASVFLFSINTSFTICIYLFLPIYFLLIKMMMNKTRYIVGKNMEEVATANGTIQQVLSGIEQVKISNKEKTESQKINNLNERISKLSTKQSVLLNLTSESIMLICNIISVLVLVISAIHISKNNMTMGDYFAFSGYLPKLLAPVQALASSLISIQPAIASLKRLAFVTLAGYFTGPFQTLSLVVPQINVLKETMIRLKELMNYKSNRKNGTQHINSFESMEMQQVTFSYYGSTKPDVENVSMMLKKGEKIAFVGSSGSGKTTITKLLLNVFSHYQGQILVNGEDIKQICKEDIDRIFAIVTQVPMAMNGTIRENVDITNTLTDEEIYHYLDLVELKDDIEKFPLGLNTFVGENGQNISGGQKQRIAIARALALKPEVIIFDEATSNLDPLTERRICNNLKQLHITQIVVTHRLNAIQDADTIYVVEKGKIIESGTHVELLQLKGAYYDSVNN